jgi:hypothetical protein
MHEFGLEWQWIPLTTAFVKTPSNRALTKTIICCSSLPSVRTNLCYLLVACGTYLEASNQVCTDYIYSWSTSFDGSDGILPASVHVLVRGPLSRP